MEHNILIPLLLTLGAGLATGIGSAIAFFARQAQRERQQPFVGAFGEKGDGAADARRKTRAERQQQGDQDIGFFHTNRFMFDKSTKKPNGTKTGLRAVR